MTDLPGFDAAQRMLWDETARLPDCQLLSLVAPTEKTVQNG